jgi:hypothetical protein
MENVKNKKYKFQKPNSKQRRITDSERRNTKIASLWDTFIRLKRIQYDTAVADCRIILQLKDSSQWGNSGVDTGFIPLVRRIIKDYNSLIVSSAGILRAGCSRRPEK